MFVTNWYDKEVTIRAVEVLAGDVLLTSLEGESLDRSFPALDRQKALLLPKQSTMIVLLLMNCRRPSITASGFASPETCATRSSDIRGPPSARTSCASARHSLTR